MSTIAVIGGGPAGLIAAETLADAGAAVVVLDQMRLPARKFLLAGRSGLNLTHHEPLGLFATRYGDASKWMGPYLSQFSPEDLRNWSAGLGQPTFVGSTNRVFPTAMQATPLLRAWLKRLANQGVTFERGTLRGIRSMPTRVEIETSNDNNDNNNDDNDENDDHDGVGAYRTLTYDAVVLALGGASWPRLGSKGHWVGALAEHGIAVRPFQASNCGVTIHWPPTVLAMAGQPVKNIAASIAIPAGVASTPGSASTPGMASTPGRASPDSSSPIRGDVMITRSGLEGGPVYALGPQIRAALGVASAAEPAFLLVDLRPDLTEAAIVARLSALSSKVTMANRLRKIGLDRPAIALLQAHTPPGLDPVALAAAIKSLAIPLTGLAAIDRAISSAGGVDRAELAPDLMLLRLPGVFACGEMLDWDAPTGGYLLQGCFSTGVVAARGAAAFVAVRKAREPGR